MTSRLALADSQVWKGFVMGDQHWLMYLVSGVIVYFVLRDNLKLSYQKRGEKGPIICMALIIIGFLSAAKSFHWGAIMILPVVVITSSVWWLPGVLDKLFPNDLIKEEKLRAENSDWDR
jgi:xanthine/uracil permease